MDDFERLSAAGLHVKTEAAAIHIRTAESAMNSARVENRNKDEE